jgi:hypothetical protein
VAVLSDLAAFLGGEWAAHRVINDGTGGFAGTATFSPAGEHLHWCERGRLHLHGYAGEARRAYLIVPDGEAWAVRFDDGRPFHGLDLRTGRAEAEHLCGPDTYRGVYEIVGDDRFTVTWTVTGPGRADTIATVYRRAARVSPSARTSA